MNGRNIFLCHAKRTPFGAFLGQLSSVPAPRLAAHCMQSILESGKIDPAIIDEVILGCVLTAGLGQAPARQAAIYSGLPNSTQALTVNKVCSSGLKAVMLAAEHIALGEAEVIFAGGMESMSQAPHLLRTLRSGARLGDAELEDSIIRDGLWDVYRDFHMGQAAELCAAKYNLSRADQDTFAVESYRRAQAAAQRGLFCDEISPIDVSVGKTTQRIDGDEEPGKADFSKIPQLRPVFQKDGTVTAANASSINDGACILIVASESAVKTHNLKPLGRIVSQGWYGQEPEWFTTAPVGAIRNALSKAKLEITKVDLFEINEAFSAVALACSQELGIDSRQVNINGGAVALGHPIGASGARILATLLYSLQRQSGKFGVAAICNGGGEATAMVVERV